MLWRASLNYGENYEPSPIDGLSLLRELERRRVSEIRQMRRDTYHWDGLSPAGRLVGWSVLITEVGALRSRFSPFCVGEPPVAPETRLLYLAISRFLDIDHGA